MTLAVDIVLWDMKTNVSTCMDTIIVSHLRSKLISWTDLGRVIDFGVVKTLLCQWLEDHYDHKFLMWQDDPFLPTLLELSQESMVVVPFNPTAENIAQHFLVNIAPTLLLGTGVRLIQCKLEETRKCSATVML